MRLSSHPGEIVVDVPHVSFNLPDRALRVGRATGRVTKRGDVVLIDRTRVDLPKSHLRVEGAVRDVGTRAQLDLGVASSSFSFPEAGVLVPGIGQIPLTAAFEARVRGPLELIDVALALRSPGGNIDGRVRLALGGASRRIDADTTLTRLDPAPWSGVRALAGSVTGRLRATVPLGGKGLSGTFRLEGPEAAAAGYEARDVVVHGRFNGARVVLEPSTARAYGARVSVSGTIEPTPGTAPGVQYALSGRVADLDLRRLPASLPVPDLLTDLTAEYSVRGRPGHVDGRAALAASTLEGATLADGSTGYVNWAAGDLRYGASGSIAGLDLVRLGGALKVPAMTHRLLAGRLAGVFAVDASGRTLDRLGLTADLALRDTVLLGAELPGATSLRATIRQRALTVDLDSGFTSLELDFVTGRPALASELNGTIKGQVTIADLATPLAFEGIGFQGVVALRDSKFGEVAITSANFPSTLGSGVLALDAATIASPDGNVKATGAVALGETGGSDLRYEIEQGSLARIGAALGQTLGGTIAASGSLSGNAGTLATEGKAHIDAFSAVGRVTAASVDATYRVSLPDLSPARARVESTLRATKLQVSGQAVDVLDGQVAYESRRLEVDLDASGGSRKLRRRQLWCSAKDITRRRCRGSRSSRAATRGRSRAAHPRRWPTMVRPSK